VLHNGQVKIIRDKDKVDAEFEAIFDAALEEVFDTRKVRRLGRGAHHRNHFIDYWSNN
jgi:hypothetical protein